MKKQFPNSSSGRIPFKKFIPGIAWFFLVLILICMPSDDLPKADNWMNAIYLDKWIHLGLFTVLTFLFMFPVIPSAVPKKRQKNLWILIAVAISLWGLTTEVIQQNFIKGRGFEWGDWLADTTGAFAAFFACKNKSFHSFLSGLLKRNN